MVLFNNFSWAKVMEKSSEIESEWEGFFISWSKKFRLNPKEVSLFKKALTHSSYYGEARGKEQERRDFEILEFLGDAVLSLAVAEFIYKTAPEFGPGELSLVKSKIVNRHTLASVAKKLGLQKLLILGKSEEVARGREKESILENALESLIGCIYIDKGWTRTKNFIYRVFREELSRIREYATEKDSKSEFQEFCQKNGIPTPEYKVIEEKGPDHKKHFRVAVVLDNRIISTGEGSSKKSASLAAAKKALSVLKRVNLRK